MATTKNATATVVFDYDGARRLLDERFRIADYNAAVQALDTTRDLMRELMGSPPSRQIAASNGDGPSGIRTAFLAVLPKLPARFTYEVIIASIEAEYPQFAPININTLRATIGKLVGSVLQHAVASNGGQQKAEFERINTGTA